MKTEGNKEQIAYIEAKKNYLAIGKRYSSLLSQVMKLDPNVLKIAEDIMITGDGLSAHDNKFIISFYNELKKKSKIDKHYYDLLLELKKTKNELDHATHQLSTKRLNHLLRNSGIPPKRTNQAKDIIVANVNNPEMGLLEKISLPDVLDIESSESLEQLIANEEIECKSGVLTPRTRAARVFLKTLERNIKERVNDDYFKENKHLDLRTYSRLDLGNILDLVRATADKDHIREIERRLESKDIAITGKGLIATTAKGKKYLALLLEELSAKLERETASTLLGQNRKYAESDPRLNRISSSLADMDISLSKHSRIADLAPDSSSIHNLVGAAKGNRKQVGEKVAELLTLQETIATSFVDIKKQLALVVSKDKVEIDKIIALMLAVRYLSIYENRYKKKLGEVEALLGLVNGDHAMATGPLTLTQITELYSRDKDAWQDDTDRLVREIVTSRLAGRKGLGDKTNEVLVRFVLDSPQTRELKRIITTQQAARKHVVDTIHNNDSLYKGIGNISEILAEITELELEKKEKIADLIHEIELSHKELWLASITNNNGRYIDTNFADLPEVVKTRAKQSNRTSVDSARAEIRKTLAKYRAQHSKHSEEFAKALKSALQQISKGGDVVKISKELKAKYGQLTHSHESLLNDMEKDILALEKRLNTFEETTPKELEKMIMSDIRSSL